MGPGRAGLTGGGEKGRGGGLGDEKPEAGEAMPGRPPSCIPPERGESGGSVGRGGWTWLSWDTSLALATAGADNAWTSNEAEDPR